MVSARGSISGTPSIYTGGSIYPGDRAGGSEAAVASALVVLDGRIAYVGTDDGALDWAGAGAEVVELQGRLVTPAFVDAHVHLVQTGQVMAGVDLSGVRRRDDVFERVSAFAHEHPAARVIVGQGWDEGEWEDRRRPERVELDRAGGGAAVYLARVDVHSAVVSTALLEQLPGIEREVGYTDEGWLSRDAHHRVRNQLDRLFSDAERREAVRAALARAAATGIAAVHELGGPHLGPVEDLVRVRDVAAETGIEVVTYWGELASPDSIATARRVGARGLAGDLCVDGAIGSRTAALREEYADAPSRGARYLDLDEITGHLLACTRSGLQAGFHCIGDDAVSSTVEAFRRAEEIVGGAAIRAARHRLEHLEMLDGNDVAVLSRLEVVASMQPAFDTCWGGRGELYERRLGRERAEAMNRLGTLAAAGVPLAFGSDSPVTPLAGWETVRAAVQHHRPGERMTAAAAFDAATRGGYRAAGDDDAGTLTIGARANLAVWDAPDAHASRGGGLPELQAESDLPACALTRAGGVVVYSSGSLAG